VSHFEDVKACHLKFNMLVGEEPSFLTDRKMKERIDFLKEELEELELSVRDRDLGGQADALVDLVYVALGTAVMMGLPWQALWDEVQRANMSKVRGVGKRGMAVDLIKPEGWNPPDHETILNRAGYRHSHFFKAGEYQEGAARDDE